MILKSFVDMASSIARSIILLEQALAIIAGQHYEELDVVD